MELLKGEGAVFKSPFTINCDNWLQGVGLFNICKDQALNQLEKQPIYNSFTVHLKSNG